jgi:hypothetical protein
MFVDLDTFLQLRKYWCAVLGLNSFISGPLGSHE